MSLKTYSELITLPTFEERFRYLQVRGQVGVDTFGHDRYLNQLFYSTQDWKTFRRDIIIRDCGCDLGIDDRVIRGYIMVHHINPVTVDDVIRRSKCLLDPENAICVSRETHLAIHYGDESSLIQNPIERTRNDTCPWRRG